MIHLKMKFNAELLLFIVLQQAWQINSFQES